MAATIDPSGAHYDQAFYEGYSGRFNQYWWARRFYAKLIGRYRGSGKLLEVGCGLGHVLMRLEDRFETYGVDVSEYAIARASRNAPKTNLRVATAEQTGELPGPFDVIASFHVVEHLIDPPAVLNLWASMLKPGGLLVFATPNPEAPFAKRKGPRWHGNHPTHIALKTPGEWVGLTRAAGCRVVKTFGDGLWDVPYIPVVPSPLQLAFFGFPGLVQVVTSVPFIPVRFAESVIVVAERT